MGSSVHVANHIHDDMIHLGKTWTSISHFYALCFLSYALEQTNFYVNRASPKQKKTEKGEGRKKRRTEAHVANGGIHNTLKTGKMFHICGSFFSHHALSLFVTL